MVADIIRDSFFGHVVRFASRNKVFQYPEEKDPSVASRYYNTEKTRNIARYGTTTVPEKAEQEEESNAESPPESTNASKERQHDSGASDSDESQSTRIQMDRQVSNVTGTPVDPEKGRDLTVVDWDGPNDPEVISIRNIVLTNADNHAAESPKLVHG